jgi:ubiquinone/menaquinone biosynthesis C-methylase UbiE
MRHWIAALILVVLPLVAVADADREATSHDADHKTAGHDTGHDATVRHSFDDVEHWVEVFDDPERDAWQKPESLIGFLGIRRGDKVADIGAGTGYFTAKLSLKVGRDGKVYAVDIEKALLDHLMQRDDLSPYETVIPVLAEPDDPKLPEGEIDLVLVVNTWHHIDDRLNYLGHIDRALGLGGRLVVVDYREGELPVGPPPGHKLSRDALVQELAKAGWSLTSESPMLPYQYVLVFHPPAGEQPATR